MENSCQCVVRELNTNDWDEIYGLNQVLNHLSPTEPSESKRNPMSTWGHIAHPKVFVCVADGFVVGTISAVIEQKVIHGCGRVCHLEDLVVKPEYRKIGCATALIQRVIDYAKEAECYKVVLNCKNHLEEFYEQFGFVHTDLHMRLDI